MTTAICAGLTLENYAASKRLPVAFLRGLGVRTHAEADRLPCVAIPYRDAAGRVVFTKYRGAGWPRFWCDEGTSPVLYGLDRLAIAEPGRAVLLVEGESDCHTGWLHGLLVLGVPGASGWRSEWMPLLAGRPVFAWQEPGKAGESFIARLAADLDNLRVVRAPEDAKDLSALHLLDSAGFRARLARLVSAASAPPPVSRPHGSERRVLPPARHHRPGCICDRCILSPDRYRRSRERTRHEDGPRRTARPLPVDEAKGVPTLEVAERLGLNLRRVGASWRGPCPIHEGKGPNFSVLPDGGFRCWTCGATGDGIGLWMAVRGVPFAEAVRELANRPEGSGRFDREAVGRASWPAGSLRPLTQMKEMMT